jgi:UDP-N-acetylglucosamine 2-epimerase (non-hydrolysing)
MKIVSVVGARPNFMKIAPFIRAVNKYNADILKGYAAGGTWYAEHEKRKTLTPKPLTLNPEHISHILVHTGQHYDDRMSDQFFKDLDIPQADINLGVGSGTHAEQVGKTMIEFEKVLQEEKPDWVVVVGDVNATLACSVTAKKENIKCCHIEAGLRSGDMSMPEEINRLVTDRLSDLLLTPDRFSGDNLRKEGVHEKKIRFVGNIMIDTLEANRTKASLLEIDKIIEANILKVAPCALHPAPCAQPSLRYGWQSLHPAPCALRPAPCALSPSPCALRPAPCALSPAPFAHDNYAILTLHRPSNVDEKAILNSIIDFLITEVTQHLPIIWPIHPRTLKQLEVFGLLKRTETSDNIVLLHPVSYHDMLRLNMGAKVLFTDSGGLQEECTVLGTPCITLRSNTERPVTLRENGGASILVGNNIDRLREEFHSALKRPRQPVRPELWDGHTAERCLRAILEYRDER